LTAPLLHTALGIPTLAVLVGILINSMQFHHAAASINARLTSVETRLDLLLGKMMNFDGRLTRLEECGDRRP
jgi:hypothetical protein